MTPDQWERVRQVFDEALDHEPASRVEFLDGACRGDDELRAEVEQLLAEDEATGGFLNAPLVAIPVAAIATGARVGPYQIVGAIGAGGMGEVYRARDTRLKRMVAIKVLPESLSKSPRARARFEHEARAAAALSHPHICALYDIGHQDGIDYLVMEYLEGETLAQRLTKGPLLIEQLLRYAAEIADALDEAHRHGVIHRDLKPSNIMLTKSGAKLLDFGIAKRQRRVQAKSVSSTMSLSMTVPSTDERPLIGTVAYMSPEQARGEEVDERTDLFSFGAVLYEMATGRRAFTGATAAQVIDGVINRAPATPRQLNPALPEWIENIIFKALQKDRELRYQTAAEIKTDVDLALHSQRAGKSIRHPLVL